MPRVPVRRLFRTGRAGIAETIIIQVTDEHINTAAGRSAEAATGSAEARDAAYRVLEYLEIFESFQESFCLQNISDSRKMSKMFKIRKDPIT